MYAIVAVSNDDVIPFNPVAMNPITTPAHIITDHIINIDSGILLIDSTVQSHIIGLLPFTFVVITVTLYVPTAAVLFE